MRVLGVVSFFGYVFLCFAKGKRYKVAEFLKFCIFIPILVSKDDISRQPGISHRINRRDRLLLKKKYDQCEVIVNSR